MSPERGEHLASRVPGAARGRWGRLGVRAGAGGAAVLLGLIATLQTASPARADTTLPEGGLLTALANFVASPDKLAGVNDWSCKPSAEHPYPVVLVHASLVNFGTNFVKLAPRLKNDGYCLFAENLGMTSISFGRIGGLGKATGSVAALSAFVDRVLSATGSDKVDLVGHSQGGELSFAYIKLAGGADKVSQYVSWGGTQHGTTLDGIASLGNALHLMGVVESFGAALQAPGMTDQAVGSAFQKQLWATSEVPAGPHYTTIQSRHDEVTTPYYRQSLSGGNNVVIQTLCPWDFTGHVGMFTDEPTIELTENALAGGSASFKPRCTGYGLPL